VAPLGADSGEGGLLGGRVQARRRMRVLRLVIAGGSLGFLASVRRGVVCEGFALAGRFSVLSHVCFVCGGGPCAPSVVSCLTWGWLSYH